MRRPDRDTPRVRRAFGSLFQTAPLPPPVYREFVDMLFSMRLPIVGMGVVFAGVAGLAAYEWSDYFFVALAFAGAVLTLARALTIGAYQRSRSRGEADQLRRWELRYAAGNYAFAVLLGLLNVRALTFQYPILQMIAVSLVFSFGAGIVSRISVRPVICVVSLLLATVPTVAGLVMHAFMDLGGQLHSELFAIQALLVAMITALSLQTVAHLYHSAVQHHVARYDMAQLARHDALTGLPNRLLLRERFQQASLGAARTGGRLAVHFIDLDGFKGINDGFGHLAGDLVLQEVSRRLRAAVRVEDVVGRLGGDEFIVLQTEVCDISEAEMLGRRIIKQLSAPYSVDGQRMRISASIGIAVTPDFGPELELMMACADAALYRSKSGGKARLQFCSPEDAERAQPASARVVREVGG